ncbi:hypothetical protein F4821DRAFT_15434 [Hypoxylon rubiginosum]|uniref:Uncharacterized protein n=1 Tax=Hypoxylon rubiginosum TaxID=110542 RepID=A0ACC0CNN4_9PEZI|nr:hypothetical protein F4821DRAFT_15434 [Hypoxylon rubiginosum]
MKSLLTQLRHPANIRSASSGLEIIASDIVSRLPFELHILILSYLGESDVDAGLSCHSWRRIWLSGEIWPKLARQWYPGLEEHVRMSAADEQDAGELFRKALHRIQRRRSGRFISALHYDMCVESDQFFTMSKGLPISEGGVHSYSDVDGLEPSFGKHYPRFMIYNNGRVAWWPEAYVLPYFAIVDDLRTRKRRAYLFPNRQGENHGFRTAMGDKLFIMARQRTLHVWHLELDLHHTATVPEDVVRCVTEGETSLIITKYADIFLWRFGQELRRIDVTGCYERGPLGTAQLHEFIPGHYISHNPGSRLLSSGILLDFIISPTEENVFFIITFTSTPLKELRVDEIRHGERANSYTYTLERSKWTDLVIEPVDFTNLRWEKVDSYGGYCLMQAIFQTPEDLVPATVSESPCRSRRGNLVSVCFNIHTKAFTIPHYHQKEIYSHQSVYQIWNNRICASDTNSLRGFLLSHQPCAGTLPRRDDSRSTPLYTTVPSKRNGLLRRQRVPFEEDESDLELIGADFALDPCPQSHRPPVDSSTVDPPLMPGIRRLVGDDDFMILVVGESYTAWSFGNEIPGKTADGGRSLWRNLIR